MKKIISVKAFLVSLFVCLVGYSYSESRELNAQLNLQQNQDLPEWVKFLAPIVAGLLSRLIDVWAKKKENKNLKSKNYQNGKN